MNRRHIAGAAATLLGILVLCSPVAAQYGLVDRYHQAASRSLPPDPNFAGRVFALHPDGRLVVARGLEILVETSARSGTYQSLGVLPGTPPLFGPAFIKVAPDGRRLAYGDNDGHVGVFGFPGLLGQWFDVPHFEAFFWSDTQLLVSTPGGVSLFDVTSTSATNPINPLVITNVGGASGGIVVDAVGRLYTGNGFMFAGPSATGTIKAFDPSQWQPAASGGIPADFEGSGTLVGTVLSAGSLGFDAEGNLLVGGGDFFGSAGQGFASVILSGALQDALAGIAPVDPSDPVRALQLDPAPGPSSYYTILHDPSGDALLLQDFAADDLQVYVRAAHRGSGEDFTLHVGVGGVPAGAPSDHLVASGDLVVFELDSPHGGLDGGYPVIVAQFFPPGYVPVLDAGHSEWNLDLSGAAPYGPIVHFPPTILGPQAATFAFTAPVLPPGFTEIVQAFLITPLAGNHFLAASNGHGFAY